MEYTNLPWCLSTCDSQLSMLLTTIFASLFILVIVALLIAVVYMFIKDMASWKQEKDIQERGGALFAEWGEGVGTVKIVYMRTLW